MCVLGVDHRMNLYPNLGARVWPWPGDVLLCGQSHASSLLTGRYATARVIACSNEMNLDCYGVMAATSEFSIASITLGRHHSMLSCQPASPEALSVPCERRADSGGSTILTGSWPVVAWSSRHPWPELLVGLRLTNVWHVMRPDPSAGRSRTWW
jgi:hypothetical protein